MATPTDIYDDVYINGRIYRVTIPVKSVDCSCLPHVYIEFGTPRAEPDDGMYDREWRQVNKDLTEGVRNIQRGTG